MIVKMHSVPVLSATRACCEICCCTDVLKLLTSDSRLFPQTRHLGSCCCCGGKGPGAQLCGSRVHSVFEMQRTDSAWLTGEEPEDRVRDTIRYVLMNIHETTDQRPASSWAQNTLLRRPLLRVQLELGLTVFHRPFTLYINHFVKRRWNWETGKQRSPITPQSDNTLLCFNTVFDPLSWPYLCKYCVCCQQNEEPAQWSLCGCKEKPHEQTGERPKPFHPEGVWIWSRLEVIFTDFSSERDRCN